MGGSDGYNVTAECFAFMTQELGRHAEGRIVLALEGGSNLVSLSQACEMCTRSLLGEQITHLPARSLKCAPNTYAVKAIEECITIHSTLLIGVKKYCRKTVLSTPLTQFAHFYYPSPLERHWQFGHFLNNVSLSVYDAVKRDQEEVDTITALASLSMQHPNTK